MQTVVVYSLDNRNSHFLFPVIAPLVLTSIITVLCARSIFQLFLPDIVYSAALIATALLKSSVVTGKDIFYAFFAIFVCAGILVVIQFIVIIVLSPIRARHDKRLVRSTVDENGVIRVDESLTFAKRLMIGVLTALYIIVTVCCLLKLDMPHGDLSQAEFDLIGSVKYTDDEVGEVAALLIKRFMNNCEEKLYKLSYYSDDGKDPELIEEYQKRDPDSHITGVIVLYTDFVGLTDTGSSMKGDRFSYTWTYARTDSGWKLVNYGW